MNNFEKIKAKGIDEMVETIVNFTSFCVFALLQKVGMYSRLDNESKQKYTDAIRDLAKQWLEEESEE